MIWCPQQAIWRETWSQKSFKATPHPLDDSDANNATEERKGCHANPTGKGALRAGSSNSSHVLGTYSMADRIEDALSQDPPSYQVGAIINPTLQIKKLRSDHLWRSARQQMNPVVWIFSTMLSDALTVLCPLWEYAWEVSPWMAHMLKACPQQVSQSLHGH